MLNLAIRTALNVHFQKGMKEFLDRLPSEQGIPNWSLVAALVKSLTDTEMYMWVRDLPQIKKWIGPRDLQMLSAAKYTLTNDDYEGTVSVDRNAISDNKLYQYAPSFQGLGAAMAEHPYRQIWGLLPGGLVNIGHDGVPVFATNHPLKGGAVGSNLDSSGSSDYFYLVDRSKPLLPLIYQLRQDPNFVALTADTDENVFMHKKYYFGVDYRAAFGYTLWQLMYACNKTLTVANFEAAFNAMADAKGWDGRKLGIRATDLIVPTKLRGAAMAIVKEKLAGGEDNTWYKGINVVECAYL